MPTYSFQKEPSVKDCCKKDENLDESKAGPLTTLTCRVCECRHRILKVEPGSYAFREKKGGINARVKRDL